MNIPGGAEAELKGLVTHLQKAGLDLEVMTTCVQKFDSNWNVDYYKPGVSVENGIKIRRFPVKKRNTEAFNGVNLELLNHQMSLSDWEEETFVRESVNSTELILYMKNHEAEYDLYVFIPYMFGTTYYGIQENPGKAVLIPCLHEESYAHLRIFSECFSKAAGMIFLSEPEAILASKLFDLENCKAQVLGAGVEEIKQYDPKRFRKKYRIFEQYILYAGRKDSGKNVDILIDYFMEYKKRNHINIKLVLIGGGKIRIPTKARNYIIDLGYIPMQDKYDAYAAAEVLCQPSSHESFSLVIMESWLCRRPVLVSTKCDVTKDFVIKAKGGLYYSDYQEFESILNYFITHIEIADQMGKNGNEFVTNCFLWDKVTANYINYFKGLISHV